MKTIFLSTLFFFISGFLHAQQLYFSPATSIPAKDINGNLLHDAWTGGINFPLWSTIDFNGDGKKDLYMYDKSANRICTFLNNGTPGVVSYSYAPNYVSRFPQAIMDSWSMCYDYNCDGKEDFFTLDSLHNGIAVWRNDFTPTTGLQFTKVSSQLLEDWSGTQPLNIFASSIYIPTFSDVDNDGDMDIITQNNPENGKFAYHKNLSMELYGTCDSLQFVFDDKCWGNFTMSLGSNTVSSYHNTPCNTPAPLISSSENEKAEDMKDITSIFAIDIDGNGTKDLLIGDLLFANSLLVMNGGTPQSAEMDSSDVAFPSYDVPINVSDYVHHAYIDVDNDGKKDLLASAGIHEDKNGVSFYKNLNSDSMPVFSFQKNNFLQDQMIETGEGACPVFFDFNADGLKDIIVAHGEYSSATETIVSRLSVYKNIGTSTEPAFQLIDEDYASLSNYNLSFPIAATFGDIDSDGDKDMIIGSYTGTLVMFENTAGAGNAASFTLTDPSYMNIDIGNNSTPQLVDMDNDGALDLVIGKQGGMFDYFHNNGTSSSASFSSTPTIDTLGNIFLTQAGAFSGYSVPHVFTFNGKHQMLTADMHGDIYYYDDIDNNLNGTFTRIDTVLSGNLGSRNTGFNLFVSGDDINSDGYMDMIAGLFSGGVQIYYGSNVHPIGIDENENQRLFSCYPNPAADKIYLQLTSNNLRIEVYNMLGEKMFVKTSGSSNPVCEVDASEFPAGIYIISASDEKSLQHASIVVEH
jgi:hypothetical protein